MDVAGKQVDAVDNQCVERTERLTDRSRRLVRRRRGNRARRDLLAQVKKRLTGDIQRLSTATASELMVTRLQEMRLSEPTRAIDQEWVIRVLFGWWSCFDEWV